MIVSHCRQYGTDHHVLAHAAGREVINADVRAYALLMRLKEIYQNLAGGDLKMMSA
jgi:hypothetical protein